MMLPKSRVRGAYRKGLINTDVCFELAGSSAETGRSTTRVLKKGGDEKVRKSDHEER